VSLGRKRLTDDIWQKIVDPFSLLWTGLWVKVKTMSSLNYLRKGVEYGRSKSVIIRHWLFKMIIMYDFH
jgi:hypothetical protein